MGSESATEESTVRITRADGLAEIVLSRPASLNAINRQMWSELSQTLSALKDDSDLRCVIVTGAGPRAFVAGADISELNGLDTSGAQRLIEQGHAVLQQLESLDVPTLAAVNGFALGGGCELVLACDLIYASEKAKFGLPEVGLGLIPGYGGTARLPTRIGSAAARQWVYTGEIYSAAEAYRVGLVTEVVAPEALLDRVREVAQKIITRGPLAVRAAKSVLSASAAESQAAALSREQQAFTGLFASEDMREGTRAFLEKRSPEFKGR